MDYLQYYPVPLKQHSFHNLSFKPYYKWITFNTLGGIIMSVKEKDGFKPYYKWITFNTFKYSFYIN